MTDREPTSPTPIERPQLANNFKPANGELKVKQNAPVKIFFTHAMDVNSLQNRFILEDFAGKKLEGSYSVEDAAAVFTPAQAFNKNSIYRFKLTGRVRDVYGNSIYYNGNPVLNDTTLLLSGWFYTEGGYSEGGYSHIYVADKSNIFVLDSVNHMVNTIKYPSIMTGYSISQDCKCLLVSSGSNNKVDFINLQTNQVEKSLPVSQNPQTITVQGNYAYVVCINGKAIEKINVSTKTLESTFLLDFFPGEIAVSTDGSKLFSLDQAKKDLVILDAASGSVLKRVPNAVTTYANGDIRTDDKGRLLICDTKGNKLNVADADNNITTAYQFTAESPVNVSFDDSFLYVAAGLSVYRLDKQTFTASSSSPILSFKTTVRSLTVLPSKDILYVVTNTSAVIIDLKSFTVLQEIPLASITLQDVISSPLKF